MKHCLLETIVDLSRYPLERPNSGAWHELVECKRAELAQRQYCILPGFLLDGHRRKVIAAITRAEKNERKRGHEIKKALLGYDPQVWTESDIQIRDNKQSRQSYTKVHLRPPVKG